MSYTNPNPSSSPSPSPVGATPSPGATPPPFSASTSSAQTAQGPNGETLYQLTIPTSPGEPARPIYVTAEQYKQLTGQEPPQAMADVGPGATPSTDTGAGGAASPLGDLSQLLQQFGTPAATTTKPVDPTITAGQQQYFNIFGVKPPAGLVKGMVEKGMDIFDITQAFLQKPKASSTQYWRDQFAQYAAMAAQIMGRR